MANKKSWLGILALLLIFGMMVFGCDNGMNDSSSSFSGDKALNGTWYGSVLPPYLILNNGNYTYSYTADDKGFRGKGVYSTTDGKIIMKDTHMLGSYADLIFAFAFLFDKHETFRIDNEKIYTTTELKTIVLNAGITEEQINSSGLFTDSVRTYSLNGKELILTNHTGSTTTYLKQ